MRASEALVIEAKKSWQRLQRAKEFFFADLEEQMKENHRRFLDMLMLEERQRFLQAHPYQRHEQRVDQANGFYGRSLTTRLGVLELQVPRSRSGAFRPQVLPRYKRREAVVDEALRRVFLCGVSTRQAGPALAGLLDEAVSAATVSTVAKVLDESVTKWHRRTLSDHYYYLILDGVSVRLRLVGKVQRRVVLCVYGITKEGKGELIDFLLVKSESQQSWKSLLEELWKRGLRGAALKLIVTDGHAGLVKALSEVWPRVAHHSVAGCTSCATCKADSKPPSEHVCKKQNSSTRPRTSRKRSRALENGRGAGKRTLLVPCTVWKPTWKNSSLSSGSRRCSAAAYAPPT